MRTRSRLRRSRARPIAKALPGRPQLAADELGHLVAALDETAIVAVTDVKGRILHANDKFCEISGYSRDGTDRPGSPRC